MLHQNHTTGNARVYTRTSSLQNNESDRRLGGCREHGQSAQRQKGRTQSTPTRTFWVETKVVRGWHGMGLLHACTENMLISHSDPNPVMIHVTGDTYTGRYFLPNPAHTLAAINQPTDGAAADTTAKAQFTQSATRRLLRLPSRSAAFPATSPPISIPTNTAAVSRAVSHGTCWLYRWSSSGMRGVICHARRCRTVIASNSMVTK